MKYNWVNNLSQNLKTKLNDAKKKFGTNKKELSNTFMCYIDTIRNIVEHGVKDYFKIAENSRIWSYFDKEFPFFFPFLWGFSYDQKIVLFDSLPSIVLNIS